MFKEAEWRRACADGGGEKMKNENGCAFAALSLSPAVDRTVCLYSGITPGALNRATASRLDPGSKGLNAAKMLAHLGRDVEFFSFSGGVYGEWFENEVRREIERSYFVKTSAGLRENIKIIGGDGVCTEINTHAGPYSAAETEALLGALLDTRAGVVCLCGSIPQGVEKGVYNSLVSELHRKGKICVLDCDGEAMRLGIEAFPDIIKPNYREAEELFISSGLEFHTRRCVKPVENPWENPGKSRGKPFSELEKAAKMCGEISDFFSVRVLCTLGDAGAISAAPGKSEVLFCPAPRVTMRGFAGAGDSFLGAYISEFFAESYENDAERDAAALRFAVAAGSAKVTLDGSRIPDRSAVESMLGR